MGGRVTMTKWIVLVVVLGLFGWRYLAVASTASVISPAELQSMLAAKETFLLVDVREPEEVAVIGIPQAINIPLAQLSDSLELQNLEKDTKIVVMCRSGARSAQAQKILGAMGFTRVLNVTGGILAWETPREAD